MNRKLQQIWQLCKFNNTGNWTNWKIYKSENSYKLAYLTSQQNQQFIETFRCCLFLLTAQPFLFNMLFCFQMSIYITIEFLEDCSPLYKEFAADHTSTSRPEVSSWWAPSGGCRTWLSGTSPSSSHCPGSHGSSLSFMGRFEPEQGVWILR